MVKGSLLAAKGAADPAAFEEYLRRALKRCSRKGPAFPDLLDAAGVVAEVREGEVKRFTVLLWFSMPVRRYGVEEEFAKAVPEFAGLRYSASVGGKVVSLMEVNRLVGSAGMPHTDADLEPLYLVFGKYN